ncbi:MAG: site-specific integrase, partial [Alicyclobacillaceae bacterium]|nr:site-specific integrase [Alicyclobacillaceae bacterium]
PRTLETYAYAVQKDLIPHLGAIRLSELKAPAIEAMYRALGKIYAPSTVHRVHRVLRTALNRAVKWGYLERSPLERVDAPPLRYKKRNVWNAEQIHQCLDYLQSRSPTAHMAAFLAAYTGMRRGEVAGLRWTDVHWDKQSIHVQRSRQHRPTGELVGPTKTTGSNRSITVGETVLETLERWKEALQTHAQARGEAWDEESYVVSHLGGGYPLPESFTNELRRAVQKLGLPPVSFHDLRHSHATLLLEEEVPLKVISERLGHTSIQLTANLYTHVTDRIQDAAAMAAEKALGRPKK